MKRLTALLLALLLLVGCAPEREQTPAAVQPVTFFYRTVEVEFSDESGLIRSETRDLGEGSYTMTDVFALYFKGPASNALVSPIPSGTKLLGAELSAGELTIRLEEDAPVQSGVDRSVFLACLVKTGLALEGVRRVRIRSSSPGEKLIPDQVFSNEDILLYDNGETPKTTTLTLFFSDADRRYLVAEERTVPYLEEEEQPDYVIRALLKGPQTAGLVSLLPAGTSLLDINVKDETCKVDFSPEFYANRPTDERGGQLVLLSITNTLCELPEISRVEFYVEGIRLDTYQTLDLSEPFTADSSVIGPIRIELNEYEGILCLPGQSDAVLHRLAVRVRQRVNVSLEEAILTALHARSAQNGLRNPTAAIPAPLSVSVQGRLAVVELAQGCLDGLDPADRTEVLRCMAATLVESTAVKRVRFESEGAALTDALMTPSPDWFAVSDSEPIPGAVIIGD